MIEEETSALQLFSGGKSFCLLPYLHVRVRPETLQSSHTLILGIFINPKAALKAPIISRWH